MRGADARDYCNGFGEELPSARLSDRYTDRRTDRTQTF